MADTALRGMSTPAIGKRMTMRRFARRRSMIAFVMALPLILLILALVVYPALYSIHLATLNKSMVRFVGLGNFEFLMKRATFWMVVRQSCVFAISSVNSASVIVLPGLPFGQTATVTWATKSPRSTNRITRCVEVSLTIVQSRR